MQGIGGLFHERGMLRRVVAELEAAGFDRGSITIGHATDEMTSLEGRVAGTLVAAAVTAATAGNLGDAMAVATAIDEAADDEAKEDTRTAAILAVATEDEAAAGRARDILQALGATDIHVVD